jgi:predicted ATP-dependent endonuclease of OLD family
MEIQRVWAKGLYGILTFDHKLTGGINLLVGINGKGKTSILNIINWITNADITTLLTTQYSEIGIEFTKNSTTKIKIRVTQTDRDLHIHGTVGRKKILPIHAHIKVPPKDLIGNVRLKEQLREQYAGLGPEKHEVELWSMLQNGPKPLNISLDRRIRITNNQVILSDDSAELIPIQNTKTRIGDPIKQVSAIARERYSQYQSELLKLNETLKGKLIAASFSTKSSRSHTQNINTQKITAIEQKLLTRMNAWITDSSERESVINYFQKIRGIISVNQSNKDASVTAVVRNFLEDDMHRISALSDALDEFESKTSKAYDPIHAYLRELNTFFSDSGKKIVFNEKNGQLHFQLTEESDDFRDIESMSSGERQILILLTHIAFAPVKTNTFIIDEPELSLHPKWQHQLLPSIDSLMRGDAQMIIATHSPEIVGNYRSRCIEI